MLLLGSIDHKRIISSLLVTCTSVTDTFDTSGYATISSLHTPQPLYFLLTTKVLWGHWSKVH